MCLTAIVVTLFLPYCIDVTDGKVKTSSELAYYDLDFYFTQYSAIERMSGIVSLIIVIVTTIVIAFTRRKQHKYWLIPIVVLYYPFWLLSLFAIGSTGFGARPFRGEPLGGFFLLFFEITTLFVIAKLKPIDDEK
ncbi:MAG: hypothetical protein ACFHU9_03455 [Fluviicola sp.]